MARSRTRPEGVRDSKFEFLQRNIPALVICGPVMSASRNVAGGQLQRSPMGELNLEFRAYLQAMGVFKPLLHGTRWIGGGRRYEWLTGLGTDQWSRG